MEGVGLLSVKVSSPKSDIAMATTVDGSMNGKKIVRLTEDREDKEESKEVTDSAEVIFC